MKKILPFLLFELGASVFLAILSNAARFDRDILTLFGLYNLVIGILFAFAGLIILLFEKSEQVTSLVVASGVLLLIGVATCSVFPFRMNYH